MLFVVYSDIFEDGRRFYLFASGSKTTHTANPKRGYAIRRYLYVHHMDLGFRVQNSVQLDAHVVLQTYQSLPLHSYV